MYDSKNIKNEGKHDYDKESAERFARWNGKSFSVNIFQWVLKSKGKELKPSKGKVRVKGSPSEKEAVYQAAEQVKQLLDDENWDERKSVTASFRNGELYY